MNSATSTENNLRVIFRAINVKTLQLLQIVFRVLTAQPPPPAAEHNNLDWAAIIVVSCWAYASNIAPQYIHSHSQIPIMSCFLALAIMFAIACFFVSSFIHSKCPVTSMVLERLGVFFGITAFFIALNIPFPLWFKCISCCVYVTSWIAILFCHYFYAT
ncbi:hypothetical protein M0R45_034659 [Rubus argutus]|uniref:Uncharacterized protein n=1 Tax=Rubus argutus TaxID=59490 RepID=A0AAW1VQV5_RUBAR